MAATAVEVAVVMAATPAEAVPGGTITEAPAIAAVVVATGVEWARRAAAWGRAQPVFQRQIGRSVLGRTGWLPHLGLTLRFFGGGGHWGASSWRQGGATAQDVSRALGRGDSGPSTFELSFSPCAEPAVQPR